MSERDPGSKGPPTPGATPAGAGVGPGAPPGPDDRPRPEPPAAPETPTRPEAPRTAMRGAWREWEEDLDPDAVVREATADIKERVELPDVGESVRVTFLEEPRKVPKERTGLDWDFFVADVKDASGAEREMICPKSVRQHLAALLERGELDRLEGATVVVSAHEIEEFETREGEVVPKAKVYRVTRPEESPRAEP